jgi:5-formyltetrahydrofolate cyclo-ligase
MQKDQVRKLYLQKRLGLSDAEFQRLNQRLVDQFFNSIDLSRIQVLHTFLPIEKQKEVNTWPIIERLKKQFPHVLISIPRINNQSSIIENFYYEGPDQLEKNTWGILEPKQGIPTQTQKIDAVLVPLLAFDRHGNRVGYGRGFYDKFLTTLTCKKIGLSFFPPVKSIEGMNDRDVAIDAAVTPDGYINLKPVRISQ